jgi:hypothetical protein
MDPRMNPYQAPVDVYAGPVDPYGEAGYGNPQPDQYVGAPRDGYGMPPEQHIAGGYPYEQGYDYGGGSYGGGSPGSPYTQQPYEESQGAPLSPGGTHATAQDGTTKSYQKYTEGQNLVINSEHGIHPEKLTDCFWAMSFILYVIGMIILLIVIQYRTIDGRSYSDTRRLTRGMDYAARLCGVDEEVATKPFLYWCSSKPGVAGLPSDLDLKNPSCVSSCPSAADSDQLIPCLYPHDTMRCDTRTDNSCNLPTGQFGNQMAIHILSQQSIVNSVPYDTEPRGGRYCIPTDESLQTIVYHGPLNPLHRAADAPGSFKSCWGILFLVSMLSVVLAGVYVNLLKVGAKYVVYGTLTAVLSIVLAISCFFIFAILTEVPGLNDWLSGLGVFNTYEELNPIFTRDTGLDATITSLVIGVFFLVISLGMMSAMTHLYVHWANIHELLDAASECFGAVYQMILPPIIEACFKFFLFFILFYNFRWLVSVGWYDDYRIVINGQQFKGKSARFMFDWWILPWIAFYIYGGVWIIEVCTAMGQFMNSYMTVSWYFMKKVGKTKPGVPPSPIVHAMTDAVLYHFGSICLGAAIVPWARIIRVTQFLWVWSFPDPETGNCCCRCISVIFTPIRTCFEKLLTCACECTGDKGCAKRYNKTAYVDVIIRSQHFPEAATYARKIIQSHKPCDLKLGDCEIVTTIGVVTLGFIGACLTHLMVMLPTFEDPSSSSYIEEPLAVDFVAFLLCASIGYGFMLLFDNTADCLLYCYAWNRRYNPKCLEKYMPETLRPIVDHDAYDPDQEGPRKFYGNAHPDMYLSSWLPSKKKKDEDELKMKGKRSDATSAVNTRVSTGDTQRGGSMYDLQGSVSPYTDAPPGYDPYPPYSSQYPDQGAGR